MTEERTKSDGDQELESLRARISRFLAAHTTLTLATIGPQGAPAGRGSVLRS